jgi:hypothetical protein
MFNRTQCCSDSREHGCEWGDENATTTALTSNATCVRRTTASVRQNSHSLWGKAPGREFSANSRGHLALYGLANLCGGGVHALTTRPGDVEFNSSLSCVNRQRKAAAKEKHRINQSEEDVSIRYCGLLTSKSKAGRTWNRFRALRADQQSKSLRINMGYGSAAGADGLRCDYW